MTGQAVVAASVIPSLTLFDVMWRLPHATFSYLLVQASIKAGVKHVERPVKDEEAWARIMELEQAAQKTNGEKTRKKT